MAEKQCGRCPLSHTRCMTGHELHLPEHKMLSLKKLAAINNKPAAPQQTNLGTREDDKNQANCMTGLPRRAWHGHQGAPEGPTNCPYTGSLGGGQAEGPRIPQVRENICLAGELNVFPLTELEFT